MRILGTQAALAVVLAWGCVPAGGGGGGGSAACQPGDLRLCECPDGMESRRRCDATGAYGPCRCGDAGAGDAGDAGDGEGADMGEDDGGGCAPDCADRECGLDPVCGVSCGVCDLMETCGADGVCACTPDCGDRVCGRDFVCFASCGECGAGTVCDDGQCVPGQPPVIEHLFASQAAIDQRSGVQLTVIAADPDGDLERVDLEAMDGQVIGTFETFNQRGFDYTLTWRRANELEPFHFDRGGTRRTFRIRVLDAQGFHDTHELEFRFICVVSALQTPACNGVCLAPQEPCDEM